MLEQNRLPAARRLPRPGPTTAAWLGCVAYLAVATLMVTSVFPVAFVSQAQAGFFELEGLIAMSVIGLIGAWLADRTGFPAPFGPPLAPARRFGLPIILGVALGALFLATDLATGLSRLQQERFNLPEVVVPFPASLFVYSAGAIYVEIVYRLLPIPLLLWLISSLLLRGRGQEPTFWALAALTSLIEPLTQGAVTSVLPPLPWALVLAQTFAANMAQAALFRRYGLIAAITLRLAFYVVTYLIGAPLK